MAKAIWHGQAGNEKKKRALVGRTAEERGLQRGDFVNNQNEPTTGDALVVRPDTERHLLEARIAVAKRRLIQDLNRISTMAKQTAGTAGRKLLQVAVLGGLVLGAIVSMFVRRRRRLRVTWK